MKINRLFVTLFVMLSLIFSASAVTVSYDSSLDLENKDTVTWVAINDALSGTLEYNSAGQEFEFSFTGTVSQVETVYALVYYIDVDSSKTWNLANSVKLATGTSDASGNLVIAGSNDLGDLPSSGDYNGNPDQGDSYCNYENGFDDYVHCSGAKMWIMPEADFNAVSWNPTAWLFETDLISYVEDDDAPVISDITQDLDFPMCTEDVKICATVIDDSEIEEVILGVEGGNTYSMINTAGDTYCKTLSALTLNEEGEDGLEISYHIKAKDEHGNYDWEPNGFDLSFTFDCDDPTADANGPYTCNEGGSVQLDGSGSTDNVDTSLDYAWDLDNDGSFDDSTDEKPTFVCGDNSVNTVSLKVTDDVDNEDTDSTTVTVLNVDPVADAGGDSEGKYHCDEGKSVQLDASGSTDYVGDTLSYAWDLDNDQVFDDSTEEKPMFTCANGDATVLIAVQVSDEDGGSDVDSAKVVIVSNVAPVVEAGADQTADEGDSVTIAPTFTDFDADTHTATVDWGDGSAVESLGSVTSPISASHTYVDDELTGDDKYTVTVTVDDGEDSGSDTLEVTVNNVDPTVTGTEISPNEVIDGTYVGIKDVPICFSATATDPAGQEGTLTYTWDFDGDGQYDDGSGSTNVCYTWTDNFEGTVGLKVTDEDGGETETTLQVEVYDYKIDLESGKNLISLPLVPEDTSVEEVLNGVTPDRIWAYQPGEDGKNRWLFHPPEAPAGVGNLEDMVPGYGYYVFMDEEDVLYANGEKYYNIDKEGGIPMPPQVILTTGWNLIGHYGMNCVAKVSETNDLSGDSLTDLAELTLFGEDASPASTLYPKEGYWVFVTNQDNLLYAPSEADYSGEGNGCSQTS